MSDATRAPAIHIEGVGKMYRVFHNSRHSLFDALGFSRLLGRNVEVREFWSLRGVTLDVARGSSAGR